VSPSSRRWTRAADNVSEGGVYTGIDAEFTRPYVALDPQQKVGPVARTRVFKSGNSQAVRIPAEMAYPDTDTELEITRNGDVITIFPARQNLRELAAELRRLPRPPRAEKRVPIQVPVRKGT
jgi:antitoxin VapB